MVSRLWGFEVADYKCVDSLGSVSMGASARIYLEAFQVWGASSAVCIVFSFFGVGVQQGGAPELAPESYL